MSRVLPILFNTDMVRAILDGRKTVTRRCVKPKSRNACGFYVTFRKSDNAFMGVYDYDENERQFDNPQTPPYQPGDILYVRETWCDDRLFTHDDTPGKYFYKASAEQGFEPKWKPSIHMPKEAARIWLRVTDVRVERLQDITEEQAIREGFEGVSCDCKNGEYIFGMYACTDCMNTGWIEPPTVEFMYTWNSTIKKSDLGRYGWDANPWVWVIEFERCEKPESEG